MGRDVYITRAAHPARGAQTPIPQEAWRDIIRDDPELHAPDEAYPSYAVWSGGAADVPTWIDWADGNLFTRSPHGRFLRKLARLAELLDAGVFDENGAAYRVESGEVTRVAPPSRAPGPIARESAEAERRISPELEDILAEVEPALTDRPVPPEELSSEILFGPKPRNATDEHEIAAAAADLHADASFATGPEETMTTESDAPATGGSMPFRVGQRVRTDWGRPATVISIDCDAEMGLGRIEIRYDDGRVAATDCVSHGLVPLRS